MRTSQLCLSVQRPTTRINVNERKTQFWNAGVLSIVMSWNALLKLRNRSSCANESKLLGCGQCPLHVENNDRGLDMLVQSSLQSVAACGHQRRVNGQLCAHLLLLRVTSPACFATNSGNCTLHQQRAVPIDQLSNTLHDGGQVEQEVEREEDPKQSGVNAGEETRRVNWERHVTWECHFRGQSIWPSNSDPEMLMRNHSRELPKKGFRHPQHLPNGEQRLLPTVWTRDHPCESNSMLVPDHEQPAHLAQQTSSRVRRSEAPTQRKRDNGKFPRLRVVHSNCG